MSAETQAKLQAHFGSAKITTINGHKYRGLLPRIVCADGTTLSVQVGSGLYCSPRDDGGPWHAVEIGYPSRRLDGIMEWAEDPERPTDTVYGYVPLSVLASVIDKCGGIAVQDGAA